MMLIENVALVREQFQTAWEVLKGGDETPVDQTTRLEPAKNQSPTLTVWNGERWNYLHSSYDPENEAARFISQQTHIEQGKHVLFYGIGLGYHIFEFVKRFPKHSFSIYEPNVSIFQRLMSVVDLRKWTKQGLKFVYVENGSHSLKKNIRHFTEHLHDEATVIVLPSYERLFRDQVENFVKHFRDTVFTKRSYITASRIFAKRIPMNNIINMSKVVRTPDILCDGKEFFAGKPAVLVAAGPSLDLEYDNLRYIKENGLAYIFSVGSAVNSLIKRGIYPDAACTYDGSALNAAVFKTIVDEGISNIPLVFGTTVGFETLQKYPGKMFHFLLDRDLITPLLLQKVNKKPFEIVKSSKTIASVTLHLLHKLGCNPIILVGQNFGFLQDQTYATGIDYINPELRENTEVKDAIKVTDVNGNEILSNRTLNAMRQEMEQLINSLGTSNIINSTKGGARIDGTTFVPLDVVIRDTLIQKNVVSNEWLHLDVQNYDLDYMARQLRKVEYDRMELEKTMQKFEELFQEMNRYIQSRNMRQLEKCFNKFDKLFDRLRRNDFYIRIILQMNNLMYEQIMKMFEDVRFSKDVIMKAKRVMDEFGVYLENCKTDMKIIQHLLEQLQEDILQETVTA